MQVHFTISIILIYIFQMSQLSLFMVLQHISIAVPIYIVL